MKGSGIPVTIQTQPCTVCGNTSFIQMTREEYDEFKDPSGPSIQVLFSHWTPDQRELLITGIHGKCWDDMFTKGGEDWE